MSARNSDFVVGSPAERAAKYQGYAECLVLKNQWEEEVIRSIERAFSAAIVQSPEIGDGMVALIADLAALYPGVAGYKVYRKDALETAARKIMGSGNMRYFMASLAAYLDQQAAHYPDVKGLVSIGYNQYSNQKDVFGLGSSQVDDISPSTSFSSMYSDSTLTRAIYWFSQMIEFSAHGPAICRLTANKKPVTPKEKK